MSFSVGEVSALLRLAASGGIEGKALTKLLTLDLLKDLGGGRYLATIDGKESKVQSELPLKEQSRFWAQLTARQGELPKIHTISSKPLLLQSLAALPPMEPEQFLALVKSGHPGSVKKHFMEQLAMAATKEEFSAFSQLLLSIHHNVLTLPLFYERYLGFLQMKKRYNKKEQKHHVDFYAALHHLGPVEGTLALNEGRVDAVLQVQFESTKTFLEKQLNNLPPYLHLSMQTVDKTAPLWEMSETLLDVSI